MKKWFRITLVVAIVLLSVAAVGAVAFYVFNRNYSETLESIETYVEIGILIFVVIEGINIGGKVSEIHDATATVSGSTNAVHTTTEDGSTSFGTTTDLQVGTRVFVQQPTPGLPREKWGYDQMVWVIREVDKEKGRALATPVLPPLNGPTPTVSGPISGPLSPFRRASIAS
jgi:hypothetical protein